MADGQQTSFSHDPVMRDESVDVFAEVPSGTILDATLGGGGHSEALLEARDDVDVIGLDRDPEALHAAAQRLEHFGPRFRTTMRRFDDIVSGPVGIRTHPHVERSVISVTKPTTALIELVGGNT